MLRGISFAPLQKEEAASSDVKMGNKSENLQALRRGMYQEIESWDQPRIWVARIGRLGEDRKMPRLLSAVFPRTAELIESGIADVCAGKGTHVRY